MNKQQLKNILYEQAARIGKALSSPKRLEILNLLAQEGKSVEILANELQIDIKLASAHLKVLKEAQLVEGTRQGKFIFYHLSGATVAQLWATLQHSAETHLVEVQQALVEITTTPNALLAVERNQLLQQAQQGDIVVIDVRPATEYQTAHLPFARSLPLDELEQRLNELPKNKMIVAYCRGRFCLMADEAITLLAARGYQVHKIREGIYEWQLAGQPIESGQHIDNM